MVKKLKLILGIIIGFLISSTGLTGKTEVVQAEEITINGTNFPDEVFRNYISVNFDIDKNNILSDTEINEVKQINVSSTNLNYKEIHNLQGIEYFTNLEVLDCCHNKLINLDLSKNTSLKTLNCETNKLSSLDISNNAALKTLNCSYNLLTKLDISKNIYLVELKCNYNELTNINISTNLNLEELYCSSNQLTYLDIVNNINLIKLNCSSNQLTNLDISKNTALKNLCCDENSLIHLDISRNNALVRLSCNNNQLTKLNVDKNIYLEDLWCDKNFLTYLDISKNSQLVKLHCYNNQLKNLDISKNIKLIEVYCENNQLTNLDTGNNTTLTVLNCEYNQIMELDLAKNSSLEKLYCAENQLINLNLSKNYYLTTLSCGHNPLAVLELSTRTIYRLKLSVTSLHDLHIRSTIISNLVNITEVDDIFQVTDIKKPATYKYSNDKYSGDFKLIYVEADEFISIDNFVNANCEHLFYDYNYTDVVSGSPIVIYGNGGTFKTGGIKTTNKKFTAYTDILASYTCTINNKGIVKPVTGKVIVGITMSDTRPFIAKNKIIDKEAAKIAKARIKNGQVTVTATGKEGGVVYLWIIDTGDKGKYECCPINVKLAPRKLQVRDEGRDIIKNPVVFNGEEIKVFITGTVSKYKEASNCTYTAEVAVNSQNYIKVTPYGDFGNQFEIKVIGFQSNKKTKASVNFICRENGKKVKFSMTILPYG